MEYELLARRRSEQGHSIKCKKRLLRQLPPDVRREIVRLHVEEHQSQQEIAKIYRVSHQLVFRLVKEATSEPEKLRQQEKKRERKSRARAAIKAEAEQMLEKSIPIPNADSIVIRVNEHTDLEVKHSEVRSVLRTDLGLGYRMVKKVPVQSNSERCLVLRQQYALKMLDLLQQKPRIINVDESWINESSYLRKMWCPGKSAATINSNTITPRLSLIAALDTDGQVYFALTQANTYQNVMLAYLQHLIAELDEERPGWRGDTFILLDGARYHTGEDIREYIHKMRLPVIWSAPYSYSTAPIELLFAGLKFGELNPERLPTGKKSLHNVGNLVGNRLRQIPRATRVRYWHRTTLELYNYLYFKRL